ncbi:N(2)-acetyl-L-2,4-diaminobutanoate deacetylase DoeB [Ruegeria sp. PrR005]|uniref:N-alpha-acetyl diaminobutyric acid deacetylase DoeB n=1 Tax=Ruegeria sp. PrR005 TaxID=2706882 RepID=A0A6B2NLX3_9RHOB|nr:N(2)-acetyl-L-2,4-diaminobutanoate deacetylase DoeB [Ruegeria sp. PrR005]NDW44220.1 N-alpha-acetyl diaminobutyric acid deacetylase DoeB [Ruegeria sp. PrR005]
MRANPITPTVDFEQDGKQHGHLRLPYSRNDSAWGSVLIPVSVIRRGTGPVALLTGANHGDEYEGPLALFDLAHNLVPDQVTGTVIIVPAMNFPAFLAGTRVSPLDQVNMNRAFPGAPDGTPTQKIADYFQRTLLPMADVVLDFHSGGKTLDFLPFAASHILEDKAQQARCRAARDAFNAPFSVEMREIDALGMYDDAAEGLGKTFVTTELGGQGSATPYTTRIARKGVRNLLIHAGIMQGEPEHTPTRHLSQPDDACFHFSTEGGLVEYLVALGEVVRPGDPIARIWQTGQTGSAPRSVTAQRDGILMARHHPGLCQAGDCLAVLAVED